MKSEPPNDPSLDERTLPQTNELAAAAPRLELVVEREAGQPQPSGRTTVVDGEHVRIGSQPGNEVAIDDRMVSRFHLRLERHATKWRLVDLGSTNGTRIGGLSVRDVDLPPGESTIEIGDSRIRVRELSPAKSVPVYDQSRYGSLFGGSVVMRKLFAAIDRVAQHGSNVLIEGESGTGKELVASEIVKRGPRAEKPFVVVDCSTIPVTLIESTLFGHVRGAFTGADRDRSGAFASADGGTVFLDEIGELPIEMQPKLLRVLETQQIQRIGETKPRSIDVRVIAATNRQLDREMNAGRFREDLYFRLSVVTLRLPPLRERLEDIDLLVAAMLTSMNAMHALSRFSPEVLEEMKRHYWPGNVRELRNYVERVVVFDKPQSLVATDAGGAPGAMGSPDDVNIDVPFSEAKDALVQRFERRYIAELLKWSDGNVARAARKAQVDRIHLHRLITRHDLKPGRSFRD